MSEFVKDRREKRAERKRERAEQRAKKPKLRLGNIIGALFTGIRYNPEKFFCELILRILDTVANFFSFTYILKVVVDGLTEQRPIKELILYVVITFGLLIVVRVLLISYWNCILPILDKVGERRMNAIIYNRALTSDIANYEDPSMYALFGRAVSGGVGSTEWARYWLNSTIGMMLSLGLSSWLALSIDPVLFIFAFIPVVSNFASKKSSTLSRIFDVEKSELYRKRDYVQRVFYQREYAKELRLTNIRNVMFDRFREAVEELIHLARTRGLRIALLDFMFIFAGRVASVMGAEIYTAYRALISNTVTVGDCLVVLNNITAISCDVQSIGGNIRYLMKTCYAYQDWKDFINRKDRVENRPDGVEAQPGDIEFSGVTFRYGGADTDTLRGIDLKIKQGERVAVVGYNGAGKTTLVKLMMRLYDPSSGIITLGGRDIREYDLKSYRNIFGVVFQDYKQFALSVAENVLGRPMRDGDEAIVEDALRRAGIWDKISELPDGMYTQMTREFSEDGLLLSGGQSQMLAIASVYAHGSPIVILDEPSSALDPLAERELYRQMYSACEGKTMIFISHRLSSAVSADKVVLVEDGVVRECGSHEELMQLDGKYAEMFRAQAESYTDAEIQETE